MFLRPDPDEGDNLFFMNFLDLALGLVQKGADDLPVVDGVVLAHRGPDGEAFLVYDDQTDNAFMCINAVKRCFNLR